MPMNEAQSAMADRVRALLADEPSLSEKSMFGSRAFMVDDRIVVAVFRAADLLVRVDEAHESEYMLEPGAGRAFMGPNRRDMGPGWLLIERAAIADDERLLFWVDAARARGRA
ncbi:TfoX/Sxy family protein [Microbacterium sp.]|uniref:TfoX/Sxy family protein n=1 Tax=Microbacterium sp. TaxID=51671 RepID=UPI003F70218F